MALLKHKAWRLYQKSEGNVVKTRIDERGIVCVKASAVVECSMEEAYQLIMDLEKKPLYDETYEWGNELHSLPLETQIVYGRFRRILIISPRDMIVVNKTFRVGTNELYVVGRSVEMES